MQVGDLKGLPKEALSAWAYMYQQIELHFQWPEAICCVGFAMLPKTQEAERPIGLTSLWYRLLVKARLHLLDEWLHVMNQKMPYDYGVKKRSVLQSNMSRLLKAEKLVAGPLFQLSVLVDLQNCFDRVDYHVLLQKALKHKYPPALLALALPVHTGPRLILADDMVSEVIFGRRPRKGRTAAPRNQKPTCILLNNMANLAPLCDEPAQISTLASTSFPPPPQVTA